MGFYERARKRLRAHRNKLEAEVNALRSVRDTIAEELEKKVSDLHEVRTEQRFLILDRELETGS